MEYIKRVGEKEVVYKGDPDEIIRILTSTKEAEHLNEELKKEDNTTVIDVQAESDIQLRCHFNDDAPRWITLKTLKSGETLIIKAV